MRLRLLMAATIGTFRKGCPPGVSFRYVTSASLLLHQPFEIVALVDRAVRIGEAAAQLLEHASGALGSPPMSLSEPSSRPILPSRPRPSGSSPCARRDLAAGRISALAVLALLGPSASACPARPRASASSARPCASTAAPLPLLPSGLGRFARPDRPDRLCLRSPSASFMSFCASSKPFSPFIPRLFSIRCSSARRSRSARWRCSSSAPRDRRPHRAWRGCFGPDRPLKVRCRRSAAPDRPAPGRRAFSDASAPDRAGRCGTCRRAATADREELPEFVDLLAHRPLGLAFLRLLRALRMFSNISCIWSSIASASSRVPLRAASSIRSISLSRSWACS